MQTRYLTYTNAALDADGLADEAVYTDGVLPLTENDAGDSLAHLITILNNSANDHSGKTFTVVGTDIRGNEQSEELVGPEAASTITTTKYFATVTSVEVSATTDADTFDIGWTATSIGAAFNLAEALPRNPVINTEIFVRVPSGTPNYSLQYSADTSPAGVDDSTSWLTHGTMTGKTASFDAQITSAVLQGRFLFTAAGTINVTIVEPYAA